MAKSPQISRMGVSRYGKTFLRLSFMIIAPPLGKWIMSGLNLDNKGGRGETTIYKKINVPRDFLDHYQQ